LIFAGSLDGSIHILDAFSGKQVYDLKVGPSLYQSPTIGSAADGKVYLYQLIGTPSYGAFAGGAPGDLMAFTLHPPAPPSWETYVPWVATGVLAAAVTSLLLENRTLRKAAKRRVDGD
jgi:hypothetical protein